MAASVGTDEAIEPEGEQLLLAQSMAEALPSPLSPSFFDAMPRRPTRKPLCANVEGFGLHAARTVAAHDRAGLWKRRFETGPVSHSALFRAINSELIRPRHQKV